MEDIKLSTHGYILELEDQLLAIKNQLQDAYQYAKNNIEKECPIKVGDKVKVHPADAWNRDKIEYGIVSYILVDEKGFRIRTHKLKKDGTMSKFATYYSNSRLTHIEKI